MVYLEFNRRYELEVHRRRVQAGMAQLLAHDVDRDVFHRQLGSTGVAQAIGMETLFNAGSMRESQQVHADRAGLQGVTTARPAHAKAKTLSLREQPGAQRFLCGALYTVFLCSSTLRIPSRKMLLSWYTSIK